MDKWDICLTPYTSHLIEMSTTPTVSINESVENKVAVTIFPNPLSTQSILQVSNSLNDASIIIYNLFGQQVKEIKIFTVKHLLYLVAIYRSECTLFN